MGNLLGVVESGSWLLFVLNTPRHSESSHLSSQFTSLYGGVSEVKEQREASN
jgi:hypothetical protein